MRAGARRSRWSHRDPGTGLAGFDRTRAKPATREDSKPTDDEMSQPLATLRKQIGLRTRLRRFLARVQRPVRVNAERAALLERVLESMREYNRIMCASAPGGKLL